MGTAGSRERARAGPSRDPRTIRRTDGWTDGRTERYGGKIRSGTVGGPSRDSPASTLLRTVSIWPSLPAPALSLSVSVSSLFVLVLVPALFRRVSRPSLASSILSCLSVAPLSSTFRLALFLLSILHLVSSRRLLSTSSFSRSSVFSTSLSTRLASRYRMDTRNFAVAANTRFDYSRL